MAKIVDVQQNRSLWWKINAKNLNMVLENESESFQVWDQIRKRKFQPEEIQMATHLEGAGSGHTGLS